MNKMTSKTGVWLFQIERDENNDVVLVFVMRQVNFRSRSGRDPRFVAKCWQGPLPIIEYLLYDICPDVVFILI